jgi:transposase
MARADPRVDLRRSADQRQADPANVLAEVEPIAERSVREYVSDLRAALFPPEAFIHRTHTPGQSFEADFGDSTARIGGELHRVLLATLPASNVYFARVYPLERLECLLDGLDSFFRWLGGVPARGVFASTSVAA